MQATRFLPQGVARTTSRPPKVKIWLAIAGSSTLILGLLLLAEQTFHSDVGDAWGLIILPLAVGLLVEAFQKNGGRVWRAVTSIPFAFGAFLLSTLAFTVFPLDAGTIWPAFIVVATLPTLRT